MNMPHQSKERLPGVLNWIVSDLSSSARRASLEIPPLASHVGPRLLRASSTIKGLERELWSCFDDELFRLKRRTFIVEEIFDERPLAELGDELPSYVDAGLRTFFEETLDPFALGDLSRCVELLKAQLLLVARLVPSVELVQGHEAPPYQDRILDWAEELRAADSFITEVVSDFCTPAAVRAGFSAGVRGDAILFALLYQNKHRVRLTMRDQHNLMTMLLRTLEESTRLLLGFYPDVMESLPQLHIEPLDLDALKEETLQTKRGLEVMVQATQTAEEGPYFPFGPPLD